MSFSTWAEKQSDETTLTPSLKLKQTLEVPFPCNPGGEIMMLPEPFETHVGLVDPLSATLI